MCQARISFPDPVRATGTVLCGDDDRLSRRPHDRTWHEAAQPYLGALQVGEDSDLPPGGRGRIADQTARFGMVLTLAMAEVQPRDVHACRNQGCDARWC